MKRTIIVKWRKRITASVLSAALVTASVLMIPGIAKAEEATSPEVHYTPVSEMNTKFEDWKADNTAVPTETGFLFGGWYKDNGEGKKEALTNAQAMSSTEGVYAKFVPDYVLSVKAQTDSGATSATDNVAANLRILTSLDSLDYQCVGVKVLLNNKNDTGTNESQKVYTGLAFKNGAGETVTADASQIFGAESKYFGAWKLTDIEDKNDSKIIYVRPYWVTMDGTTVYGLAKYLHVEDSYNDYITIPINLMSGEKTAAGIATIQYDSNEMTFKDVQNGHVANAEMECDGSTAGVVKIVGNETTVNKYAKEGESLFASVRFQLNNPESLYSVNDNVMTRANGFLKFTILASDFSDWDENPVDAGAWNIQY